MSICFFYDPTKNVPFNYLTPTRYVGEIPSPYEAVTTPQNYLEYAIADYADNSQRGLVNAFGNAKRALHLAIDILLNQYGLFHHFSKVNFPFKLQLLDDIGILPITIMKNLNVERNLIEHEYDTPPKNRVAEAIDVVKLLLLATEKLLESTPQECVVGWRNPKRHVLMQLEPVTGELQLFTLHAKGRYKKQNGINYFTGPLRRITRNTLTPGVKISKQPWKTITLNKTEANEWRPILTELVNVQRKSNVRQSLLDRESAQVTIPLTIPLPDFGKKRISQIIDELLEEKFKDLAQKNELDSNSQVENVDQSVASATDTD